MVPFFRIISTATQAFSVVGPMLWNGLIKWMGGAPSLALYRKVCKAVLFQKVFDGKETVVVDLTAFLICAVLIHF